MKTETQRLVPRGFRARVAGAIERAVGDSRIVGAVARVAIDGELAFEERLWPGRS
jgi:hypothetical protein